jgi:hypothetical protein
MPRYDVFLSHASADKPAVEFLARKLQAEGLEPFLDKWHLVPGEPWQEALEEALDQSRTCAVFLGKQLGPWQNEEMRSALAERVRNHSIRVIPVLLPGGQEPGKEELPRFSAVSPGSTSAPASTMKMPSAGSSPASGARHPDPAVGSGEAASSSL